ncbi:glycosyltransferase family 4 protein [Variovorax sp. M-6]|uniref:glycosyltransferase family 4 protein n=1 Tax=Variovorax sp. M-6 TaxID=3233041 RepID=UPI003F9AFE89
MSSESPVLVVGTASIHVRRFVAGLCEAGQSVVLVTESAERLVDHPLLLDQQAADFTMRRKAATGVVQRCIEQWRPKLVHAHQASNVAWHAGRAARHGGLPLVLTLWGSDVLRLHEWNWLYRHLMRSTLRAASAWTADAPILLSTAERICHPKAAPLREWIPIGIDPPPAIGVVQRERRVLSCRLHKPLYRIDAILRAFAGLPEARDDWILEVAGAGDQSAELQQLARHLGLDGRVEFTGMLSATELARAYRRSALFVSVPESDGTAVSLLEAMAAGCLPVLSDLAANREWVQDGRTGLLVSDLAKLGTALSRGMQWWASGQWDKESRLTNELMVTQRALLANNMRQFMALYDRVAS